MKTAEALVFDFNGTLFWDSKYNLAAWNEISLRYRGIPYSLQEREQLDGRTSGITAAYFLKRDEKDPLVQKVIEEKEDLYARLCVKDGTPHLAPGATELWKKAREKGYKLAIATSAPKRNMEMYCTWWPELKQMDAIVCDDGKRRGKPMPDIYLDVCKALECEPASVIVFEDSVQGIMAARAAKVGQIWQEEGDTHATPVQGTRGRITDFRQFLPLL